MDIYRRECLNISLSSNAFNAIATMQARSIVFPYRFTIRFLWILFRVVDYTVIAVVFSYGPLMLDEEESTVLCLRWLFLALAFLVLSLCSSVFSPFLALFTFFPILISERLPKKWFVVGVSWIYFLSFSSILFLKNVLGRNFQQNQQ